MTPSRRTAVARLALTAGALARPAGAQAIHASDAGLRDGLPRLALTLATGPTVQTRDLAGNRTPIVGGAVTAELRLRAPARVLGRPAQLLLRAGVGLLGGGDDAYELSTLALGTRVALRRPATAPPPRWQPYADLTVGARFGTTNAADGLTWKRATAWSPTVAGSLGSTVRVARGLTLDVAVAAAAGPWTGWRRTDGTAPPNAATAAGRLLPIGSALRAGLTLPLWGR